MTQYTAPLRDMNFVLNELAGLAQVAKLPGFEDAGPETVEAILEEAAKFASQVLAPINAERHLLVFVTSSLAILPLAAWMGRATEELAEHLGEGVGGLLNATFGNAAELIISLVAL